MKLVFGGAAQGKRAYAHDNYNGESTVEDFHLLMLELLENGVEPLEYVKAHMEEYRDKVVICDDISSGIVPVNPRMREWREAMGHTLALIAKESDEVVRVFCGLGVRLK